MIYEITSINLEHISCIDIFDDFYFWNTVFSKKN